MKKISSSWNSDDLHWLKPTAAAVICVLIFSLLGCSTPRALCKEWQREGLVYSTLTSCMKCVNEVGEQVEIVNGCAIGLDAASLLIR